MIKTGIQWARKDGKDYWYVWVDFTGTTLRSDWVSKEEYAKEIQDEIVLSLTAFAGKEPTLVK